MATVLSSAYDLSKKLRDYARLLQSHASSLSSVERISRDEQSDGKHPLDIKALIDGLLENINPCVDEIATNIAAIAWKSPIKWVTGSPPGVGWFRTGYYNTTSFKSVGDTAMGKNMILYNDVGPNYNLFYSDTASSATHAVKANDIISVDSSYAQNIGRYTIKYDTAAKGNGGSTYGLTQGDFSGGGSDWTAGTDWTVNTGSAVYSASSGTTARTCTQALSGMSTTAAYTVQFTVTYTSGAGTLKCDIAGDYYFQKTLSAAGDSATYSFTTNPGSTTPTLTFTATRSSGTFAFSIDDVYVYGAPVLFTVEEFDVDSGEDVNTTITLEQTAA